jgi:hypothetical protein
VITSATPTLKVKQALKVLGRRFGLRCISVVESKQGEREAQQ